MRSVLLFAAAVVTSLVALVGMFILASKAEEQHEASTGGGKTVNPRYVKVPTVCQCAGLDDGTMTDGASTQAEMKQLCIDTYGAYGGATMRKHCRDGTRPKATS